MLNSKPFSKAGIKVLIVDDDKNICESIHLALKEYGYPTEFCIDSVEAFDLIVQNQYQLIITDIKMPKLNGLELLKKIKNHSKFIRVLMITGYSSLQLALECMEEGADDFLFKPFEGIQEVFRTVDMQADRIHRWRSIIKQASKINVMDVNNILE